MADVLCWGSLMRFFLRPRPGLFWSVAKKRSPKPSPEVETFAMLQPTEAAPQKTPEMSRSLRPNFLFRKWTTTLKMGQSRIASSWLFVWKYNQPPHAEQMFFPRLGVLFWSPIRLEPVPGFVLEIVSGPRSPCGFLTMVEAISMRAVAMVYQITNVMRKRTGVLVEFFWGSNGLNPQLFWIR